MDLRGLGGSPEELLVELRSAVTGGDIDTVPAIVWDLLAADPAAALPAWALLSAEYDQLHAIAASMSRRALTAYAGCTALLSDPRCPERVLAEAARSGVEALVRLVADNPDAPLSVLPVPVALEFRSQLLAERLCELREPVRSVARGLAGDFYGTVAELELAARALSA